MITSFDFFVLNNIQNLRCAALDAVMAHMLPSTLAAAVFWIAVCAVMLIRKDDRPAGVKGLLALLIGTVVFAVIMKNCVMRLRPFMNENGLLGAERLLIRPPSGYSFPSGHSVSSFAAAFSVFLHKKRLGAPCLIIAAAVAFSRTYLYVHFPSDVICGAVFGILSALAANAIVNNVVKRTKGKEYENKLSDNS